MEFTKEEKIEAYEYAKSEVLANPYLPFMCIALDIWAATKLNVNQLSVRTEELFPEFIKRKPKDMEPWSCVWFSVNPGGNEQRIALLEECINELKSQLIIQLTLQQKIEAYEHARPGVGMWPFMCMNLADWLEAERLAHNVSDSDLKEYFPELFEYQPVDSSDDGGAWFDIDDTTSRNEILTKVINQLKLQIDEEANP